MLVLTAGNNWTATSHQVSLLSHQVRYWLHVHLLHPGLHKSTSTLHELAIYAKFVSTKQNELSNGRSGLR